MRFFFYSASLVPTIRKRKAWNHNSARFPCKYFLFPGKLYSLFVYKNEDSRNATRAKLRKDDSYIYRIKDNDLQNATQAEAREDDSYIYHITDEDLRNATQAKLKKDDSYIYHIKDENLQNATKAEVKEDDSYIYHIQKRPGKIRLFLSNRSESNSFPQKKYFTESFREKNRKLFYLKRYYKVKSSNVSPCTFNTLSDIAFPFFCSTITVAPSGL